MGAYSAESSCAVTCCYAKVAPVPWASFLPDVVPDTNANPVSFYWGRGSELVRFGAGVASRFCTLTSKTRDDAVLYLQFFDRCITNTSREFAKYEE